VVRRPLVVRALDGGGELVGFVLGAGIFTVATSAGQDAHRLGAFDGIAVAATAGWGIAQAIFGTDRNLWRRGSPMRVCTGPEARELPHSEYGEPTRRGMLLASTLERFPMGMRPFGSISGLKLAVMDHPLRRLFAAIPAVAFGWESDWLIAHGLHRCATDRILLDLGGRFILDGEAFPEGKYEITQGPPLSFAVP
jgi:hypothetical protein